MLGANSKKFVTNARWHAQLLCAGPSLHHCLTDLCNIHFTDSFSSFVVPGTSQLEVFLRALLFNSFALACWQQATKAFRACLFEFKP